MTPRHDASTAQIRAADPDRSTWVMANAGSGKTRVLTDRVARLLLAGTRPERILCLTYTRTAAAEMQERLFRRLGAWAMMADAPLRAALAGLQEDDAPPLPADALARARTLFALALETPGGLKIQTIHAFCDGLLRRFPLESGVSPGFRVLDDRGAALLREGLRERLARAAERGEDPAFDIMAGLVPDQQFDAIGDAILSARPLFAPNTGRDALARVLGAQAGVTAADLADHVLGPGGEALLRRILPVLRAGSATDVKDAGRIGSALAASDPAERLRLLEGPFLFGGTARDPYGPRIGKFPTKLTQGALGADLDALNAMMQRCAGSREDRLALRALDRAAALHRFARALLDGYAGAKDASGTLDFDDLVARARTLLTRAEMAAWVLWKLDGGIDHILVDEAQDTSPLQWDVIAALAEEALSGEGARSDRRTVFAVGDLKQSIYSFQGARPRAFAAMRDRFRDRLRATGDSLPTVELLYSFRSAPPILALVDGVFQGPAAEGLSLDDGLLIHQPFFDTMPGRVELWPWLPPPDKPAPTLWWEPVDTPPASDPRLMLAGLVADRITAWLAEGLEIPDPETGEPRPMRPGDVLVLVQRRDLLARGIVAALKARGVPVAGEDRMLIGSILAVRDVLAVLRFVSTPADDLSLAAALRSPLFGLSEDALEDMAAGRDQRLLWQVLREKGPAGAVAILQDLRDAADYLRPHELIERLLTRHGGRAALLARLGPEIEEALDELLSQALAFETAEVPTLAGFLHWMDASDIAVKREPEQDGTVVRMMTVHGAKGLEAPVVILPDTGARAGGRARPVIEADGLGLWAMGKEDAPAALRALQDARDRDAAEERRRLLYVALTRARALLVVCGAGSDRKLEDSWYGLVRDGMERCGPERHPAPPGMDGETLVLQRGWTGASGPQATAAPLSPARVPDWVEAAPPAPPPRRAPIGPSGLGGAHALPGTPDDPAALARGTRLHDALERLAVLPADAREAAARLLVPEDAAEALAALALPDAAAAFGPDSLAEVAVTATLPDLGGRAIMGRIDRLAVTDDHVLALDIKTNALVPPTPDAVPEGILRQMGAYQAALERIHPGRRVTTAILWTAAPALMPLPRDLVMAALRRAGASLDPAGGAE